jgi:hypothetical protein
MAATSSAASTGRTRGGNGESGPIGLVDRFAEEEVGIRIGCTVHAWAWTRVGVFRNPFHGVTDEVGQVTLHVPPGDYEISAWHEFSKFVKPEPRPVTVAAGETKEIEFVFEVP